MRLGGGAKTAVLESLGLFPGDVGFEEKFRLFRERCLGATAIGNQETEEKN